MCESSHTHSHKHTFSYYTVPYTMSSNTHNPYLNHLAIYPHGLLLLVLILFFHTSRSLSQPIVASDSSALSSSAPSVSAVSQITQSRGQSSAHLLADSYQSLRNASPDSSLTGIFDTSSVEVRNMFDNNSQDEQAGMDRDVKSYLDVWENIKTAKAISTSAGSLAPVPVLPVKGECIEGAQYHIQSVDEIKIDQLECLFAVALPVDKVPLGALYGNILAFANTAFYSPLINLIYQGDYVVETKCRSGKTYYLNVLKFGGISSTTGLFYLGKIKRQIAANEHYEDMESLVMDFSVSIPEICPVEGLEGVAGLFFRPFWSDVNSNIYPVKLFQDHVRLVGRNKDGCLILLGRTFMTDPLNPEGTVVTSWYFTLTSCDRTVNASFTGTLPPLNKSFTYERSSGLELLKRANPLVSAWVGLTELFGDRSYPWHNQIDNIPLTRFPTSS
eukprot:GHVQ01025793.1.p1 GENE.GHVQ01025793.1~~GHVQ01025793.1.p1  ORF type:complete len:444 (+),score=48.27 GHVQ01025793.1:462-1793(+)